MNEYDKRFYSSQMAGSISSAERIVPYIIDMLLPIPIISVVDFGCGVGGWLDQFQKVSPSINVLGLDFGNPDESQLQVPLKNYRKEDLAKKIDLGKKFDLCISLEVAEHIYSESADDFIDNLCRHSDIVLFSAAIPGQGGTDHVNEQPLSYWVEKFKYRNYVLYDVVRPFFWNDKNVDVWYRQNTVLFIKDGVDIEKCHLKKKSIKEITDIAHPELFYGNIKAKNEKLINWGYFYVHNRKLYVFLRKMKHLLGGV